MIFLKNFLRKIGFNFRDEKIKHFPKKIDFEKLERKLKIRIKNKDLFFTALSHRSFLKLQTTQIESNERLEFFGDSIVNMIAGKFLFQQFPKATEGDLTHYRSHLVSKIQLSSYAEKINLWDFILFSNRFELSETSKGGKTILADAFEAIVAAIYFDLGISEAEIFLLEFFKYELINGSLSSKEKNAKSALLEYLQAEKKQIPRYAVIKKEGPDHDMDFTVAVFVDGIEKGRGIGKNKKEAEQIAAAEALKNII